MRQLPWKNEDAIDGTRDNQELEEVPPLSRQIPSKWPTSRALESRGSGRVDIVESH